MERSDIIESMAQNITFIPAVKTVGTQKPAEKKQKVCVAAYCRVSTEFEEQESSYETQVAHYTSYINGNPEWEMVGGNRQPHPNVDSAVKKR